VVHWFSLVSVALRSMLKPRRIVAVSARECIGFPHQSHPQMWGGRRAVPGIAKTRIAPERDRSRQCFKHHCGRGHRFITFQTATQKQLAVERRACQRDGIPAVLTTFRITSTGLLLFTTPKLHLNVPSIHNHVGLKNEHEFKTASGAIAGRFL